MIAIGKEYGKEITPEQTKKIFDKLKATATGELSENDLEDVAGGGDPFGPLLNWIGGLFGK